MDKLLRELKSFYKKHQRSHLPWRGTRDPYKILVSEMMLQQTQVERVVPFYEKFIKKFPTPQKLAKAKLSEVLKFWSGLGYNRRAKYLYQAAEMLRKGEMNGSPTPFRSISVAKLSTEFLESLPGVGPYTARAVAVFAYNKPEVFIETNIRTVFIHFCYASVLQKTAVRISDGELLPLVAQALKKSKMQPRDFYAALMDYGSYLKQKGIKLNSRSKHYTRQSKFKDSARQLRGAILREMLKNSATSATLSKIIHRTPEETTRELLRLQKEGLVKKKGSKYLISE